MTYPSGVQLSTLTFNSPTTYLGNPVTRTEVTVQVTAGVVWAATGDPINDAGTTVALGPGVPGAVTFPVVDQPGFTDQAGTATTMWSYVVTRKLFFGSASQATQKNWQPLTGQATIDFDNLPGQDGGGPTYPPAFPVTSVAGQAGVVDAQALAGALVPFLPSASDAAVTSLITTGTTTTATTLNGKFAPVIVVKQSSSGDDTTAAQGALDVCRDAGGGEVVIPYTGTDWRFNKLTISRNTIFRCQPGVIIKRKGNSYGITNIVPAVNPLKDNTDPYSGHGNIQILGGTWDGNIVSESYLPAGFNLFYLAGARDILIEGVTVRDMVTNHCVDVNGISNLTVRRCRFLGYKDATVDASRGYVEAIQCSQNMDDSSPNFYPMLGTPSKNILVDHCTFGASGTVGTIPYPAGFGTHSSSNDPLTNNITIRSCTFEGQGFAAIPSYTYNNIKIIGNTFTGCAYGLKHSNFTTGKTWDKTNNVWITGGATRATTTGIVFAQNVLIDTVTTDVSALGTNADGGGFWGTVNDINIHDNKCLATTTTKRTGQNIRVLLGKTVRVHDNDCYNGQIGVLIDSCVNVNNHDNYVDTTQTYGIQHTYGITPPGKDATYPAANRIVNNHIANAGSHGIGNNTLSGSVVEGNTVDDWGRVTPGGNGILTSGTNGSLVNGNRIRTTFTGLGAAIATATTNTSNVNVTYTNKITKPDGVMVAMGTGTGNVYGNMTYTVTG